ncbi:aa3-type cytochrome c oxidase subunit IV [uncultured Lentibacter sp.]|nr:aa3-type cytochrome c oxidase subunit IV [uncultured Lentibacter sp.]
MSDHKHGEMDTKVQEDTFSGFMTWVTRTTIVIILALIFVYMVNG